MLARSIALACAVAGCGRIAFDPLATSVDANESDIVDSAALPSGLVAHYELDGTYVDSIAGNNGTCVTSCPTSTAGHVGTAMLFDGSENCITVPDAMALRPPVFTISVWARMDATVRVAPVSKTFGATTDNSYQLENTSSALLAFRLTTMHANTDISMTADNTLVVGQWQHLVGSWDGSIKRVYIDGAELFSGSVASAVVYDAGPVLIGCDNNMGTYFSHMLGAIDDVQIYDRALGAAEIAALAQR